MSVENPFEGGNSPENQENVDGPFSEEDISKIHRTTNWAGYMPPAEQFNKYIKPEDRQKVRELAEQCESITTSDKDFSKRREALGDEIMDMLTSARKEYKSKEK